MTFPTIVCLFPFLLCFPKDARLVRLTCNHHHHQGRLDFKIMQLDPEKYIFDFFSRSPLPLEGGTKGAKSIPKWWLIPSAGQIL